MSNIPFDPFAALRALDSSIPQPKVIEVESKSQLLEELNKVGMPQDVQDQLLAELRDFGVFADAVEESLDTASAVNPKEIAGSKKPGVFSVFPRWVSLLVGRVMETGASKYGKFNYRDSTISASVYEDAMERHAQLWFDGEDNDPESGVSHLAHVIACATLLLDAQASGKLHDNRQKTGVVRRTLSHLEQLRKDLPFPGDKPV